jgi:hypothetical protein
MAARVDDRDRHRDSERLRGRLALLDDRARPLEHQELPKAARRSMSAGSTICPSRST